jgi:hypothetical protein
MTAFVAFDAQWARIMPTAPREASRRVDTLCPVGWFIRPYGRPIRRWQSGNNAPDLPPG